MSQPFLGIRTVEHLCKRLGISETHLRMTARLAKRSYREFLLSQPNGKDPRPITEPGRELKKIQEAIYKKLIRPMKLSASLHGGIPRRSVLTNAKTHSGKRYLVNLDIRKFFPSISSRRVFRIFQEYLGCSAAVAGLLTDLTTYKGCLPQGTPTSCALANLVSHFVILPKLRDICSGPQYTITMYIDDISISSDSSEVLQKHDQVMRAIDSLGFKVHPKNTQGKNETLFYGKRMTVNGLVVNQKPNVRREWVKDLRARIHRFQVNGNAMPVNIRDKELNAIRGQIAFTRSINPVVAGQLHLPCVLGNACH